MRCTTASPSFAGARRESALVRPGFYGPLLLDGWALLHPASHLLAVTGSSSPSFLTRPYSSRFPLAQPSRRTKVEARDLHAPASVPAVAAPCVRSPAPLSRLSELGSYGQPFAAEAADFAAARRLLAERPGA